MLRRLAFYVFEAGLLTIPTAVGVRLVQLAMRRLGYRPFALTRGRLAVLFLILALVGLSVGEGIGPQSIPQYYLAILSLGIGFVSWAFSLIFGRHMRS